MSFTKSLPSALKELRVHMCQTSPSSAGLRQFILKQYPTIKANNPDLKVLIREAGGVEAKVFARFEMGKESSLTVSDLSAAQVEQKIGELITRG